MSKGKVIIKINRELIEEVRKVYPELREVSDADVVRIMLRKAIQSRCAESTREVV